MTVRIRYNNIQDFTVTPRCLTERFRHGTTAHRASPLRYSTLHHESSPYHHRALRHGTLPLPDTALPLPDAAVRYLTATGRYLTLTSLFPTLPLLFLERDDLESSVATVAPLEQTRELTVAENISQHRFRHHRPLKDLEFEAVFPPGKNHV